MFTVNRCKSWNGFTYLFASLYSGPFPVCVHTCVQMAPLSVCAWAETAWHSSVKAISATPPWQSKTACPHSIVAAWPALTEGDWPAWLLLQSVLWSNAVLGPCATPTPLWTRWCSCCWKVRRNSHKLITRCCRKCLSLMEFNHMPGWKKWGRIKMAFIVLFIKKEHTHN